MRYLLSFITRHEPRGSHMSLLKSGAGSIVAMTVLGAITAWMHYPLLLAPLGATAVVLFAVPSSPLAQPANVLGGYCLAAVLGLLAATPGFYGGGSVSRFGVGRPRKS